MKFLIIIIVVLMYKNWWGGNPIRELVPVNGWFSWLEGIVSDRILRYLSAVILPSLVLFCLSFISADWMFGLVYLVVSLLVVVYSIDFVEIRAMFDDHSSRLPASGRGQANNATEVHNEFCRKATYTVFRSFAPVIFWFLLLGPGGAILYALSAQYSDHFADDNGDSGELSERILYWLEWVPARISGLIFALLGDFRHGFTALMVTINDFENTVESTLSDVASSSLYFEQDGDVAADHQELDDHLNELQWLLDASIWGWVALAALLTILGW